MIQFLEKTAKDYRDQAASTLVGKMTPIVLATLILFLISGATSIVDSRLSWIWGLVAWLVILFIEMPIAFSYTTAFLPLVRNGEHKDFMEKMFGVFSNGNYVRALSVSLLTCVYILLWMLLLVIPGIVKSYSYAMTYYIAKDHPEMSAEECIHESRMMMQGYKAKLFLLDLSYIGWILLGCLTLGILLLWVEPKIYTAHVHFYEDLKAHRAEQAVEEVK